MVWIVRIQELELGVVRFLGSHQDLHLRTLPRYEV
jgi:hypothetical protein